MKFGNSNHQNVKMPDWIWSSGPDLAPLSRNRVKWAYIKYYAESANCVNSIAFKTPNF